MPRIVLFAHLDQAQEAIRIINRHGRLAALVTGANRKNAVSPALLAAASRLGADLYIQPARGDSNYRNFATAMAGLKPDILVSFSHAMFLAPEILSCAKLGGINLHNGVLPRYRGSNVINWAVINGESHVGVSLHWMVERIDAGPVIASALTPIALEDTALTVRDRLIALGWELLDNHLPDILAGKADRVPQDENLARTWPRRTIEDGYLDWNWPAERIFNLIRGLVLPWPGAWYINTEGQKIIIDHWLSLTEVKRLQEIMTKLDSEPPLEPATLSSMFRTADQTIINKDALHPPRLLTSAETDTNDADKPTE